MLARQNRTLTLLAGALVVAALLLVRGQGEDAPAGPPSHSPWIDDLELTGVESVRIARPGGALELQRVGTAWTVNGAPADRVRVEALLSALTHTELGPPLGDDLAAFGLAPPRQVLTLLPAGGEAVRLSVGDDPQVGRGTYVQREGEHAARATRARLSTIVGIGADDLEARALIHLRPAQVQEIHWNGQALHKDVHGWWMATAGGLLRVDTAAVGDALRGLAELRREDGRPADPPQSWRHHFRIVTADGSEELWIGPPTGEQAPHIRTGAGPLQAHPVQVRAQLVDGWDSLGPFPPASWLLPVHGPTLERIVVTRDGAPTAHARADDGWSAPALGILEALGRTQVDRSPCALPPSPPDLVLSLEEGPRRTEAIALHATGQDWVARDLAGGAAFCVAGAELAPLIAALGS